MTTVGVIGLGEIGRGVGGAIHRAGSDLVVFDVRPEAAEPFSETATVVATAEELASRVDVFLVAVVDDRQVTEVLVGRGGALRAVRPGTIAVILSTVAPSTILQMEEAARSRRVDVVDCGVTGGPSAAAAGTLVSMVGGEVSVVDRLRPVIESFSSMVVHMGPLGAGMKAKLARMVVQYGSWLAAYEGQLLAEASGIDLVTLAQVIRESDKRIGGSTALMFRDAAGPLGPDADESLVTAMRAGARLAHKDLHIALGLARDLGLELPLAELAESCADHVFGIAVHGPADSSSEPDGSPSEPSESSSARMRGLAKMREVYGFAVDPTDVPGGFAALTVDHLFGEIWTRPGLSVAQRRLLTIGVLAAFGQFQILDVQFSSALDNGELTEEQVREVVVHLAHYVGWPLALGVSESAERLIGRRHKDDK